MYCSEAPMVFGFERKTTERDGEVDSDSACLVGLFLAPLSLVTTGTVTPSTSVLTMLRGTLAYLLHFLELHDVLYHSAPLLSGSRTPTIRITYRVYLTNGYAGCSLTQ